MGFCQRLDELMTERGLNNLRLSKETGVADRLIGAWKKGEKRPGFENLVLLAEYFEVSLDYLVGRSDVRKIDIKKEPVLEISENGREMLELYEQLPERKQLEMIGYIRRMVDEPKVSGCEVPQSPSRQPSSHDGRAG